MAIAFGASTRIAPFSGGTSATDVSPSVSGSDVLGVVLVATRGSGVISGVTWDGVSMSEVTGAAKNDSGRKVAIYQLVAPAAGVTNVTVTGSSAWGNLFACVCYFTGVDQTTPIDTSGTQSTVSSTTSTVTGTTNNANEFFLSQSCNYISATYTLDGSSTSMQAGSDGTLGWRAAYQSVAAAGSPVSTYTSSSGDHTADWISIIPASSGATWTPRVIGQRQAAIRSSTW